MNQKSWITDSQKKLIQNNINKEQLLEILGADHIKITNNQIRCSCPIHGGDNPTAFALFPDFNWSCFTHQCHGGKRQDLFSLVMKVKRITFVEAAKFLALIGGVTIDFADGSDPALMDGVKNDSWARHTQGKNLYQKDPNKLEIEDNVIRKFIQQRTRYLIDRGFTNDTLNEFEIGHCYDWLIYKHVPEHLYSKEERVTFPIRWKNKCIGLQGRCVSGIGKEKDFPDNYWPRDKKYDNLKDFVKSNYIYNFEKATRYANMTGRLIICEGISDVMMLWQIGIRDSVCVFGSSIDVEQIKLLCGGLWNIYIFFDNDDAGNVGSINFFKNAQNLFNIYRVLPPDGKDPASLDPNITYELIMNAKMLDDSCILN